MNKFLLFFAILILQISPSFSLPGDELIEPLKYRIEKHQTQGSDTFNPLSLAELDGYGLTPAQRQQLIEYASRQSHPLIYDPSDQPNVRPEDYSINLMWINRDRSKEEMHFLGSDDRAFIDRVIKPIVDWRTQQPDAYINFWYDSEYCVNAQACIDYAMDYLRSISTDIDFTHRLRFRNIRDLAYVQSNAALFNSNVAVYFRVDLTKALIGDHLLRNENLQYAINADCDIAAVNSRHLFNKRSHLTLDSLGYLFGDVNGTGTENSFIFYKNNPLTVQAHRTLVVDRVIAEAYTKLRTEPLEDQDAFKYAEFRKYVWDQCPNKQELKEENIGHDTAGFSVIGPQSQFGALGYNDEQRVILRRRLEGRRYAIPRYPDDVFMQVFWARNPDKRQFGLDRGRFREGNRVDELKFARLCIASNPTTQCDSRLRYAFMIKHNPDRLKRPRRLQDDFSLQLFWRENPHMRDVGLSIGYFIEGDIAREIRFARYYYKWNPDAVWDPRELPRHFSTKLFWRQNPGIRDFAINAGHFTDNDEIKEKKYIRKIYKINLDLKWDPQ